MSSVEQASKLRNELKSCGYSNRKVSVSHSYCGYSASILVIIKDLSIPLREIHELACSYQEVSYCEKTSEILEGGNTYVQVRYDYELIETATENKLEEAKVLIKGLENKNESIGEILFETSELTIYITKSIRYDRTICSIHFENKDGSYNESKAIPCFDANDLARFLVLYDYQIKEKEVA